MENSFHLNIFTPEKTVYNGDVVSLTAPGGDGYLGILAGHAPLITTLVSGTVAIKEKSGERKTFQIKGSGFLEVLKNQATMIADQV